MEKCSTCKWFQHLREGLGECHRFPPSKPYTDGPVGHESEMCSAFPSVYRSFWCGEYWEA